jgi:hypothetical protein
MGLGVIVPRGIAYPSEAHVGQPFVAAPRSTPVTRAAELIERVVFKTSRSVPQKGGADDALTLLNKAIDRPNVQARMI